MSHSVPNQCKNCGGKFKVSTSEYVIRSRHSEKNKTVIENLDVLQCTICGNIEMTESSEHYIRLIRQKITNEMKRKIDSSHESHTPIFNTTSEQNNENPIKNIKSFFKKIIG